MPPAEKHKVSWAVVDRGGTGFEGGGHQLNAPLSTGERQAPYKCNNKEHQSCAAFCMTFKETPRKWQTTGDRHAKSRLAQKSRSTGDPLKTPTKVPTKTPTETPLTLPPLLGVGDGPNGRLSGRLSGFLSGCLSGHHSGSAVEPFATSLRISVPTPPIN